MKSTFKLAVFDMDNCLFDDRHRQPLIDKEAPLETRYEKYHAAMVDDKPYLLGIELLEGLIDQGYEIVINTARPEKYITSTWEQLIRATNKYKRISAIIMRLSEQEGMDTPTIKNENLREFLLKRQKVTGQTCEEILAFDDRPDMVAAYGRDVPGVNPPFYANIDSYVLTGGTIISLGDDKSMHQAFNSFKGRPFANNTPEYNTIRLKGVIKVRSGQWLNIAYSQRASDLLTDKAKIIDRMNIRVILGPWEESDFPGAAEYNSRRKSDLTDEQKSLAKEMFGVPGLIGFDWASWPDISAVHTANCRCTISEPKPLKVTTAADILGEAADTFRERNAVYKDNAGKVGEVMEILFPNGVRLKTEADHKFYHLFELLIVKLTRFTNSGLHHEDSIHDLMVYAAMLEAIGVDNHDIKTD